MSKRSRERKLQQLEAKQEIQNVVQERYRQDTAKFRNVFKWIGISVVSLAALALIAWGGIYTFDMYFGTVSGPFGEIARSELNVNKFATIITDEGEMKFELDTRRTPKTAANFVLLAKDGFYNGIKFHRIVKDFMVQSGDPNSKDDDPSNDGMGGPGYTFEDEKITGEYTRGTLAMANSGPDTNGSQFFIMHKDTELPPSYVIFGKLVDGMDVLDKIADEPVEFNDAGEESRPVQDVVIESIVVSSVG